MGERSVYPVTGLALKNVQVEEDHVLYPLTEDGSADYLHLTPMMHWDYDDIDRDSIEEVIDVVLRSASRNGGRPGLVERDGLVAELDSVTLQTNGKFNDGYLSREQYLQIRDLGYDRRIPAHVAKEHSGLLNRMKNGDGNHEGNGRPDPDQLALFDTYSDQG